MKTVLVPTDFSTNAANAIAFAVEIINQIRGKLILCHVLDSQILGLTEEGSTINPEQFLKNGYLEELNKISKNLRLENGFRFEVETLCESGPLNSRIASLVEQHQVDLIVMGTRGASTFLDKLIGTNTLSVMEEVTCPVLAIPAKATFNGFKNLTYASDFEKEESYFLRQLFHFAEPLQAEVHILNVKAEEQPDLVPDTQVIADINKEFASKKYSISQIKGRRVLEGLQAYIKENKVDVVAVAKVRHSVWETLFNTSVSAQLAFEGTLPLLALPAKPVAKVNKPQKKELLDSVFSFFL